MSDHSTLVSLEVISDAGDVLLQCGKVDFQVFSHTLTAASFVLQAKLQESSINGTHAVQDGLIKLVLPDENTDAMRLLLHRLHSSRGEESDIKRLNIGSLFKLATASDTYNCVLIVDVPILWALRLLLSPDWHPDQAWKATAIAYMVDQPGGDFEQAAQVAATNASKNEIKGEDFAALHLPEEVRGTRTL